MGDYVGDLPLVARARPLPVLWRQRAEELFESLRLRMHDLCAVCIRVHTGLLSYCFFSARRAPNARFQALPEAAARHERRLEAVACTPLILIEAPSPAHPCGMLT